MSKHSDEGVRVGDAIIGRCVTMNSIHTGKVAKIIQTPGEYTTRFELENEPESGRSAGRTVFYQGFAPMLKSIAVDGEPGWDEHARVIVYTEGTDFAGEQVFDIPVHYFHEPYDAEDPQGPRHEVVEAATHWVLRDDFVMSLPRARVLDDARDISERDAGAEAARAGVQEVSAGFDDVPFASCPEGWTEKPFCRIEWIYDGGDPGVGHPARSGWSLAREQAGTVVADLVRLSSDASAPNEALGADAAAVAAWKWGYEYLQRRMASLGREGWAHDCDEEIAFRIAQGIVPAATSAAKGGE